MKCAPQRRGAIRGGVTSNKEALAGLCNEEATASAYRLGKQGVRALSISDDRAMVIQPGLPPGTGLSTMASDGNDGTAAPAVSGCTAQAGNVKPDGVIAMSLDLAMVGQRSVSALPALRSVTGPAKDSAFSSGVASSAVGYSHGAM